MIGTEMLIESWSIDRPTEYIRNARKITQAAVDKVAASLQEFGFRQPIVVIVQPVVFGRTFRPTTQKTQPERA